MIKGNHWVVPLYLCAILSCCRQVLSRYIKKHRHPSLAQDTFINNLTYVYFVNYSWTPWCMASALDALLCCWDQRSANWCALEKTSTRNKTPRLQLLVESVTSSSRVREMHAYMFGSLVLSRILGWLEILGEHPGLRAVDANGAMATKFYFTSFVPP